MSDESKSQIEASLKAAGTIAGNLPANLRESDVLTITILELMKRFCANVVAVPGAPPPQLMAIAKAIEATFAFAEMAKVPRGMVFDIQFQVLLEGEIARLSEAAQQRPGVIITGK